MKKTFDYKEGKFIVEYKFNDEHLRTLFVVKANDNIVAFENRNITCEEDLDGNDISWQTCDELVEMGLLWEDEEAFELTYELTSEGEEAMNLIASKF